MPTTHDDAPRPRARRPLGRGAGEAATASAASEMPETPEECRAVEVPVQPPAVDPAAGPGTGAEVVPEQPEAVDAADGTEPHGAADGPQGFDAARGPEAVHVPQSAAVPGEESPETDAAAAEPVAGDGGGEGTFTLRLDNFEGPFDLLLQLISKHKLDVTEVALSKVTDDFMAHIRAMGPDWDLDQTTEFLVVAATLLDLKAARLLPAAEVEDEADLALLEARDLLFARLLQYRAYKRIADIFSGRLADESRRYPRTVGLEPHLAELLPEVVISIGAEGFARLAVKAMQPKAKPQVYVDHIHAPLVSVREQAEVVMVWLREAGEASFAKLVADAPDTLTVVARFLALLELYRERVVALEQEEALGELMVRWTGAEGAAPQVTDEFDREPGQHVAEEEPAEQAEEEQT
ncbi:ScpA family protein [Streptomyces sp. C184]|uniref:ScpA family protein n=1 Tax=Streptomyces sp. C184 TaxID=3237121 RepID=UPI0034C5D7AB